MTTALVGLSTAATTLAADTDHHWGLGEWWPVVPLLWLLFWVAVVTVVARTVRRRGGARSGQAVLAERYARGEIGEAEYSERLAVLRRGRRG